MEHKKELLLILIGMFITVFNGMFLGNVVADIIGSGLLVFAALLILKHFKEKRGYESVLDFCKNEMDKIVLMTGVVLIGLKYFFPDPFNVVLHYISLAMIILVLLYGQENKMVSSKVNGLK